MKATFVAAAMLSALALAACGGGSSSSSSSGSESSSSASSGSSTGSGGGEESGGGGAKVTMINSGSRSDSSWTQSWFQGSEESQQEQPESEVTYVDQLESGEALEQAVGAALTQGANAVMIATSQIPQALEKYGEQFPEAWICDVESERERYLENVCTIEPEFVDGAFLAGVAAALATKTNHLGAVGAFETPTLTDQIEAFILGARYINPEIKIDQVYTGSLVDSAKARAAAAAQYGAGADIVFSAVDDAIRGIYSAAREQHGLVIAQYTDQYEDAPDVVLTSVLYHLNLISKIMINHAIKGDLEARPYVFSLNNGPYGELAPFRGKTGEAVDAADRKKIEGITKEIESGAIKVPGVKVLGKVGAGEEVDPSSVGGSAG
ncbi:MAG TPA: BMP family ABC transporter substrate-binding protein [Solirubrobacterales bacterium]